jgi:(1->4)-alpha-D-glucan 1-alpha-D-glucosylmutase
MKPAQKRINRIGKVFRRGDYVPLEVAGRFKDHVITFARSHSNNWAITVAPRFLSGLIADDQSPLGQEVWQDTRINMAINSHSLWKNVFTGKMHEGRNSLLVGEILQHFPVALLFSGIPTDQHQ